MSGVSNSFQKAPRGCRFSFRPSRSTPDSTHGSFWNEFYTPALNEGSATIFIQEQEVETRWPSLFIKHGCRPEILVLGSLARRSREAENTKLVSPDGCACKTYFLSLSTCRLESVHTMRCLQCSNVVTISCRIAFQTQTQ